MSSAAGVSLRTRHTLARSWPSTSAAPVRNVLEDCWIHAGGTVSRRRPLLLPFSSRRLKDERCSSRPEAALWLNADRTGSRCLVAAAAGLPGGCSAVRFAATADACSPQQQRRRGWQDDPSTPTAAMAVPWPLCSATDSPALLKVGSVASSWHISVLRGFRSRSQRCSSPRPARLPTGLSGSDSCLPARR